MQVISTRSSFRLLWLVIALIFLCFTAPAQTAPAPSQGTALQATPQEIEVQHCREEVRLSPSEAFSHENLALALFNAKQPEEALQEVQTALHFDPDSVQAHTTLGLILSANQKGDAAEAQYQEALKLDPDDGTVHNNLGVVYFNRQQWKQAEHEFRKALQADHSDPYAHHNLADTLLQQGRQEESILECDRTLRYEPAFYAAYGTRGLVEDKLGQSEKGLADLMQSVKIAPVPADALLQLAGPLRQFAGHETAAQQFGAISRLYPLNADIEEELGRFLLADGQDAKALASFQAVVRLEPNRAAGHILLARTWLRLSRLPDSIAEARTALRLEPGSGEANNLLGLALYQSGQAAEARQQWQAALKASDKDAARNAAGFLQEFP